jgi:Domain of unknown function (DUF397)
VVGKPAEVSPGWRTSSYSGNGGAQCVEAGQVSGVVLVRDTTQHGRGPVLQVTPAAWRRLTTAIRSDQPIG